jgi:hypothetical protein
MKVIKIVKTNHVFDFDKRWTLCGLALRMHAHTQTEGKVNCKKCIERIFYCTNLNKQMVEENE